MTVKSKQIKEIIISNRLYNKWQEITDFLAMILKVTSVMIRFNDGEYLKVFVSSRSENNPYKTGDKINWHDTFCEKVISSGTKLLIKNALEEGNWKNNKDIELGLVSYFGIPINYPDKTLLGTLCALDNKEHYFEDIYQQLLLQNKKIIEHDLLELKNFERKERVLNKHITKQLVKINEKENCIKGMLDSWLDTYFHADLKGNITMVNKAAISMFGYISDKEMIGMHMSNFYQHPGDYYKLLKELELKQKIKDWNSEGKKNDGSSIWMSINIQYVKENGTIVGTEGFIRDITEGKNTEEDLLYKNQEIETINEELKATTEALLENDELLRKISDNYPNSFISVIEKDLTISLATGQEYKNRNLNPKDFIGRSIKEVFGTNEPIIRKHFLDTFQGEEIQFELLTDNRYHLYKTVPLYDNYNIISRILVVTENITSIKKIQNELIESKEKAEESNRLKTAFLHNLSHEIRTPLNGIVGFSSMITNPDISSEKQEAYSSLIKKSSNQLLRIIDDILEISYLETQQVSINNEPVSLNHLLDELHSLFMSDASKKNLTIHMDYGLSDDKCQLLTDRDILLKILRQLIENAIKFTNEGSVFIGYVQQDSSLNIYIKDTGIGISDGNQNIIFERFSQEEKTLSKKHGGLGLGLSISKEYANLLGGSIYLESQKGIGSSFYLTLPFIQPEASIKKMQVDKQQKEKKTATTKTYFNIIVAEDEESVFFYLNEVLEEIKDLHFNILHAHDGYEAIDLFEKNSDIDFILMDIKMPNMNGYEATKIIKSKRPDIPVIIQTAYATFADKQKAYDYGCDDYISKPIDEEKLQTIIQSYVNK